LGALLRLGGPELGAASGEELRKDLGEAGVGRLEGVLEAASRRARELADGLAQVLEGAFEVGALGGAELVPPANLLELGEGSGIDVTQTHQAGAELLGMGGIFLARLRVRRDIVERLGAEVVALGEALEELLERDPALGQEHVELCAPRPE